MSRLDELQQRLENAKRHHAAVLAKLEQTPSDDLAYATGRRGSDPAIRNYYKHMDSRIVQLKKAASKVAHIEDMISNEIERQKEAARERFTADQIKGATHIRDRYGWHKVVRVNQKSVTVETGYSWNDSIRIDKILDLHTLDGER